MLVLIETSLVAGGAAAGFCVAAKRNAASEVDPGQPRLVLRDGGAGDPLGPGRPGDLVADAASYRSSYYQMADDFTSNLSDGGIVELSVAVSTLYDRKVLDNLRDNEVSVRSAINLTLAVQDSTAIRSTHGKAILREKLREAVNASLIARTGYGGINDVYFTSFVTQ